MFHDGGSCRRLFGKSFCVLAGEDRFAGTVDDEDEDEDADGGGTEARTAWEDDTCELSASSMSLRRCCSPESFLGGVGVHGIASASLGSDSWLAGAARELDEKSRLTERSPDMGCFVEVRDIAIGAGGRGC